MKLEKQLLKYLNFKAPEKNLKELLKKLWKYEKTYNVNNFGQTFKKYEKKDMKRYEALKIL